MSRELIFLYGPPGSGKSTAGKALAADLQLPFFDLDGEIEARAGKSIPEIFEQDGEDLFRTLESAELHHLSIAHERGVIALGGGALLDEKNRRIAEESGRVALLTAAEGLLIYRAEKDNGVRPLLAGDSAGRMKTLLKERREHYASFDLRIEIDNLSPVEIAMQIQTGLGRFHLPDPAGRTCGYDVLVRSGGLAGIGEALKDAGLKGPLMIVTDENVARYYLVGVTASLSAAGYQTHQTVIPAGEEHKTITMAAGLWEAFLNAGLERGSTVLALSGGVVSDLAGFAAATYLRGVRWAVAPTTLLAMVDAGLGGKTGIDLPQGKNLAGAFHSPSLAFIDPRVLATLPEVEFRSGMAETLKHGIIADPHLYRMCLNMNGSSARLEEMVARAVAVKVQVVRADPFESGRRAVLNLGHTIGHAVELASGYSLRHGEAVAIGLAAETRLSEELGLAGKGLTDHLRADLKKLGLPVDIPAGLDPGEIMAALKKDKKKAGGSVRFALASKIGAAEVGIEIDERRIWNALNTDTARA